MSTEPPESLGRTPPPAADLAARDTVAQQRRASAGMSALTLAARAVGFARVWVVALVFGASFLGDTYAAANQLPNLVFELVAAGALSSVLVPALVERLRRDDAAGAATLASQVLGTTLVVMGALALVGMLAATPIAEILFSRTADPDVRAEKVELGTFFLRIFMPQVLFYTIALVMTAVLHAYRRFLVPAAAPLWNNAVVITVYVVYGIWFGQVAVGEVPQEGAWLLAVGTTLGVVALALPQWWAVHRMGVRVRPVPAFGDPEVRHLARLGLYAIGYLGLNNLLFMYMVVLVGDGGVVPLQSAWQFFLLPWALFATPLATSAFPSLSRLRGEGDVPGFAAESGRMLGQILFTTLPVAVVYGILAAEVAGIFRVGAMDDQGVATLATILRGFSLAVPVFCLFLGLTRVAYAHEDTRLPTLANAVGVAIGAVVMWVAIDPDSLGVAALGLGFAVAYLVSCVILVNRRRRWIDLRRLRSDGGPSLLAAGAMAAVTLGARELMFGAFGQGTVTAFVTLAVAGLLGLAVYLAVTRMLRVPAWDLLKGSNRDDTGTSDERVPDTSESP